MIRFFPHNLPGSVTVKLVVHFFTPIIIILIKE
jgi:hypothetical protein